MSRDNQDMGDSTPTVARTPSLDAARVRVNLTIERDFIARGVFPELRFANAAEGSSGGSFHYVDPVVAAALLFDARQQYAAAERSRKKTFRGWLDELELAIDKAARRPAQHASAWPECVYGCSRESWRGTRQQLRALGIVHDGPWPGEPGGAKRVLHTEDGRGWHVRITRADAWGLFSLEIDVPEEARPKDRKSVV